MHSLDFHHYLPDTDVPILATLHLPPDWYPASIFKTARKNFYLNCVSSSQRNACPESHVPIETIPNGVDTERLERPAAKRNYALAMGRICPEKGFHLALDAAKRARCELLLAGEVFPYEFHREYFKQQIAPRLDERRRFLGPVGFARKRRLLAEAKCLLIPSTVQETSSLVAMEALAAGTPVIAFPSGALPEIVKDGQTGFLVSNAQQMARAISAVGKLNRDVCKRAAQEHFSASRMIQQYLHVYDRIISEASERVDQVRVARGTSWLVSW
jgi:glycosyltransferase involved in cell wall biosynthesis